MLNTFLIRGVSWWLSGGLRLYSGLSNYCRVAPLKEPVRLSSCSSLTCPHLPQGYPPLPDGESCTKTSIARSVETCLSPHPKFTQDRDGYGSNIHCTTLGAVTGQMGDAWAVGPSWPHCARHQPLA